MTDKKWLTAEPITSEVIDAFPEINRIILQLLHNRGLKTQVEIDQFLTADYAENLHDPFLFTDMAKAVERILAAIENKEKIVVYGDYDADGVSSSTVMVEMLTALGAEVKVYIPFRETEGYGMNAEAVNQIATDGAKLVITVDCGISNKNEVEILKNLGVDVIITDHHHQPIELPEAFAIINPNVDKEVYPFRGLTGAGVAFKVSQALMKKHVGRNVTQLHEGWEKWLLDVVAIGTVADMQPLLDENRVLVKYGLLVLQKTRRVGIQTLLKNLNGQAAKVDERLIGWQIAPRLNAAGRLNHASSAYQLLITNDQAEGEKYSEELNQTNRDRQQITDKIRTEADQMVGDISTKKILIVVGDEWPTGVVGLVSGRLTDRNYRPSLVISRFKGAIIGSGRSIPEFNIVEALQECDEFLARYGGHAQACGFTVKDEANLALFIKRMNELAEKALGSIELIPQMPVDCELDLEEVNWALFDKLMLFSPYGEKNPKPTFLARNLTVTGMDTMGKDNKHLRLMVSHKTNITRKTVGFSFGEWAQKLKVGSNIDMVFEVDVNEWNGNRELQLKIVDLKLTETT